MPGSTDEQKPTVTAEIGLRSDDWELRAEVRVPTGPVTIAELLPIVRSLSDTIVRATQDALEHQGAQVSCRAGCGACCRNLVAISEVEARRLRTVVAQMSETRRDVVMERFAAAGRMLHAAGLLKPLLHPEDWTDDDYDRRYRDYFKLGIACPFLEEEACSIYEERPLTCREYLVTSPPAHCARPEASPINRVLIPLRVFNAVARWQVPPSDHLLERWVPLIVAMEWSAQHPDDPPPKPGPQLLNELLQLLSGQREDAAPTP